MLQFEEIIRKVQVSRPGDDLSLLRKAYEFSASEHKTQTRISGEPFVSHPLAVANVLADMKLDVVCLVAGMLHDVVEDTPTTVDRISQEFGPDVARIVEGVTKISRIEFVSPEAQQIVIPLAAAASNAWVTTLIAAWVQALRGSSSGFP